MSVDSSDYEAAMDALMPFVEGGIIQGNPEELELIAHAVLDRMTPAEVVKMIDEERKAHRRMLDAWERDIEARQRRPENGLPGLALNPEDTPYLDWGANARGHILPRGCSIASITDETTGPQPILPSPMVGELTGLPARERKGYRTRLGAFIHAFRVMYHACRTDYPCEGCEQPRLTAFRNAVAWAWRNR